MSFDNACMHTVNIASWTFGQVYARPPNLQPVYSDAMTSEYSYLCARVDSWNT